MKLGGGMTQKPGDGILGRGNSSASGLAKQEGLLECQVCTEA